VRGFFENGGLLCYVLRLDEPTSVRALRNGLAALEALDDVDLVCAPDVMGSASMTADQDLSPFLALQHQILDHCQRRGDRFAILDGAPLIDAAAVAQQRAALGTAAGPWGALYWPWVLVPGGGGRQPRYVPPCGHVAGVFSRSDRQTGVHKAPANEELDGVLDLRVNLPDGPVGELYDKGVNCLRALPGRGIRIWGARTLSQDAAGRDVNVRRVLITVTRWVERFMVGLVHEPNDVRLWVRVMRELTAYLDGLFQRGALKGRSAEEAFYVKCDSETNPPAVRDLGMVVTELGMALAAPAEFIVVRIIHGSSGVAVSAI
jgi:phage tail sheath protein FI